MIRIIFLIIFVTNDSDGNVLFHLNDFHIENELNIKNNLLEKWEKIEIEIVIYFCECFPIEIEII